MSLNYRVNYRVKDVTPTMEYSEYKRSRHNRRYALKNTWDMLQGGWQQIQGERFEFEQEFRNQYPECFKTAPTDYRAYARPTRVDSQEWWKSPIKGVTVAEIFSLAQLRYFNDPEQIYRQQYEMRRVLDLSADEIKTELMLFELGAA